MWYRQRCWSYLLEIKFWFGSALRSDDDDDDHNDDGGGGGGGGGGDDVDDGDDADNDDDGDGDDDDDDMDEESGLKLITIFRFTLILMPPFPPTPKRRKRFMVFESMWKRKQPVEQY